MKPGDLALIKTYGDSELDEMLVIVMGDGPNFSPGVDYNKVFCPDGTYRYYLDDSLEKPV